MDGAVLAAWANMTEFQNWPGDWPHFIDQWCSYANAELLYTFRNSPAKYLDDDFSMLSLPKEFLNAIK